jgi:hypothetical protein
MRKRLSPGIVLGMLAVVIACTGTAGAAALITSAKIKDGTIQGRDIKNHTITLNKLATSVQKTLALKGATGATGATGAKGDTGATGATGPTLQGSAPVLPTAGNWGIIDRNTIGSPQIDLRSGPATPPLGKGSLNFIVGSSEKVAFGNELDSFAGGLVQNITQVGFRVFETGEDIDAGHGAANMPGITFEIDPNVQGVNSDYSSLVFMPDNTAANQWSGYIDGTTSGKWGLTGSKFAGTTCDINGARCTWQQVQAYLDDNDGNPAKILTVAVTKGRDYDWQGAVDGLRINDTVLDFEEGGISTTTA